MGVSKVGNLTEECVGDGVFLFTLERGAVRAVFTNWGATLVSLFVPDAQVCYVIYTSNFLDGVVGKGGAVYNSHAALCLETQGFPNAVNKPRFPSVIVRPGETYRHVMVHKFYTQS